MPERNQLRDAGRQARQSLTDRDRRSELIIERLFALAEFASAQWVLFYVHVRTEVQTLIAMNEAAAAGKQIAVPYCVDDDLRLFHWQQDDDLSPASFGILEPRFELRKEAARQVRLSQLDLVVVPGLVFDSEGNRLGYGRGYYDRLLAEIPKAVPKIGLAFDCQMVATVPHEPHDQPVDWVLTESRTLHCWKH